MTRPHLFQLVRRAAAINPRGPAICDDGVATWAETLANIEAMAGRLAGAGVRPGDRVAILAANSGSYIEALFAIPRLGAIAAPLNTRLSLTEIAALIHDAGARLLLADAGSLAAAAELRAEGAVDRVLLLGSAGDGAESLAALTAAPLPPEPAADEVAFLLYTGGSTGRPKGVMHTSSALIANVHQSADVLGDTRDMRFLYVAPLFHVGALAYTVAMAMHAGANVPLPAFEPQAVLRAMERERITHVALVPTMLSRVLEAPDFERHDLASLRRIIYGASPISEALLRRAMAAFPDAQFAQSYGQTETVSICVLPPWRHVVEGPLAGKLKSAGPPAIGVDVKILADDGSEVGVDEIGEIVMTSDSLMVGYWNQPEITAETLRDGWLHTGDMGFIDQDGVVTLVDRKKDMIISGGENIYSVEVEDVLARHPAVLEYAVVGLPDPHWGERVHAVVRLRDGAAASAEELIEHCRAHLSHYKCPRSVTLAETPLPLSGAGKVLKRELRVTLAATLAST
ncbi:MAG: AMP-binding protein [Alphaproteobacteria bacterium]|nr:AMP-binding protein [Alphaproteobacteria bacterium]MBU1516382.1 AMP-binding protein [Alphaproteobacteria bacterium]MBU2093381.1 AMP-binding protein [Alphaproteobacteria bacterium]MBU2153868.1 AMP-binding protein [Alphaproteobacteria bacterium]MBU2307740.1 AMP-binding protein [Alphaproteobacteria bacterium]